MVSVAGKSPLALLHGWAMTPAVWMPLRAALGDIACVAANDDPPPQGLGTDDAALSAWADSLAPSLPPASTVVGWSLGALLALELARAHPARVARLILIAATPRFVAAANWPHGLDAATLAAFVNGYARRPAITLRRFLALQTLGDAAARRLLPALEAASVTHEKTAPPRPALINGLNILATADLRPHLAAITQPVHLLHGDGDALMPLAAAHWLAHTLPDARLTVLDKRGHAPLLSCPAECAAAIRATLTLGVRP
ncbi:MAG: alpha/beta fold hydrolase [Azoarcus sp.]|jgi:pimeloyl-[acyl-carrier protein] methyl ester esterase|nr:alpha/beta fold hydrolase [Azoarcus sp.]